jgi:hypothetical protein
VSRREHGREVVVGRSPLGIGERFPMDTRARGIFILQQLLRYLLEPPQFSFFHHFEDGGEDATLAGVCLNGKYCWKNNLIINNPDLILRKSILTKDDAITQHK